MTKQQAMLQAHFESLGAKVWYHEFPINHPLNGRKVIVKNMIVTWHPERRERIMLCTHYDTRPQADKDPKNPQGKFQGANDGASGVGLFAELGRHMPAIDATFGVDFVFFDAEEFVFAAAAILFCRLDRLPMPTTILKSEKLYQPAKDRHIACPPRFWLGKQKGRRVSSERVRRADLQVLEFRRDPSRDP
jgi:hypothetical protein